MSMWIGWMTERLKVPVSKTGDPETGSASSNLAPAATTTCEIEPDEQDDRDLADEQGRVGELV